MRMIKVLVFATVAYFGSAVVVGLVRGPEDGTNVPWTRPAAGSGYSHEELQRAANMTQQMSTPNADTDPKRHGKDEQLQRSQSVGYVQALEQHQADLDRMLARGTP